MSLEVEKENQYRHKVVKAKYCAYGEMVYEENASKSTILLFGKSYVRYEFIFLLNYEDTYILYIYEYISIFIIIKV